MLLVGSILAFSGCLVGNMHGKNNVRSDEFRYSVTKSSEYSVDMNKATPGDTSNVSNKRKFDVDLLVHIIHLNALEALAYFPCACGSLGVPGGSLAVPRGSWEVS